MCLQLYFFQRFIDHLQDHREDLPIAHNDIPAIAITIFLDNLLAWLPMHLHAPEEINTAFSV